MATENESLSGCAWYAKRMGWELKRGNLMVEGTSDVDYFYCASRCHYKATGLKLLGEDFAVFAAGLGDSGGTYGVLERFPTLFQIALVDLDHGGKRRHRCIALLDDDNMGRSAVSSITRSHRQIIEYESIFRLRRIMPMKAGSSRVLEERTRSQNLGFGKMDCVIEDLLPQALTKRFLEIHPNATSRPTIVQGLGVHYYWTDAGKRDLLRFVKANATAAELAGLIEVLKALRSYVNLPSDGII